MLGYISTFYICTYFELIRLPKTETSRTKTVTKYYGIANVCVLRIHGPFSREPSQTTGAAPRSGFPASTGAHLSPRNPRGNPADLAPRAIMLFWNRHWDDQNMGVSFLHQNVTHVLHSYTIHVNRNMRKRTIRRVCQTKTQISVRIHVV